MGSARIPDPEVGARVAFERIDPACNARRFYAITVAPDPQLPLFEGTPAGLVLVVARGRIGRRPILRRRPFATLAELARVWRRLVALRRRRGYVEVAP